MPGERAPEKRVLLRLYNENSTLSCCWSSVPAAYRTDATHIKSLGTEKDISDLSDIFDILVESRVRLSKYESKMCSGIQERILRQGLSRDYIPLTPFLLFELCGVFIHGFG